MNETDDPQTIPPFERFDHVQLAIPAGGEDTARSFYRDVLGLRELTKPPEFAVNGGAWFASGDVTIHLGVDTSFVPARKAHPAFRCTQFDQLVAHLHAHGVELVPGLPFEGCRRGHVSDPFGNLIELVETRR